jgi:hypothetical protein
LGLEFVVFWVVVPCSVAVGYQRFEGPYTSTSTLKMEAARSSETLLSNHHTTRHNNPANLEFYLHRRENLKSIAFVFNVKYTLL